MNTIQRTVGAGCVVALVGLTGCAKCGNTESGPAPEGSAVPAAASAAPAASAAAPVPGTAAPAAGEPAAKAAGKASAPTGSAAPVASGSAAASGAPVASAPPSVSAAPSAAPTPSASAAVKSAASSDIPKPCDDSFGRLGRLTFTDLGGGKVKITGAKGSSAMCTRQEPTKFMCDWNVEGKPTGSFPAKFDPEKKSVNGSIDKGKMFGCSPSSQK